MRTYSSSYTALRSNINAHSIGEDLNTAIAVSLEHSSFIASQKPLPGVLPYLFPPPCLVGESQGESPEDVRASWPHPILDPRHETLRAS